MPEPRGRAVGDPDLGQRVVQGDLPRGAGQQVLAAQDVGDPHQRVVDRVDQRVERLAVAADEHEVRDVLGGEGDRPADEVVPGELGPGHPEAQRRRATLGAVRRDLLGRQVAAVAVVPGGAALLAGLLAAHLELLGRAEALVGAPGGQQVAGGARVDLEALRLPVGAVVAADARALVPVQAQPASARRRSCS